MKFINVQAMSQEIREDLKLRVDILKRNYGTTPALTVVSVGDDPASKIYIRNKMRGCEEVGVLFESYNYQHDASLIDIRMRLTANNDHTDGVILQLPTPFDKDMEECLIENIPWSKDIDCLRKCSRGAYYADWDSVFSPCTSEAIIHILRQTLWHQCLGDDLNGKVVTVIGRSELVGRPLAHALMRENATVTLCHSYTSPETLHRFCKESDIVVSAVGKPGIIDTGKDIRPGAIVIDVGITKGEDGRIHGDVIKDPKSDCLVTPVPRGVGVMTVTKLLEHVVISAERRALRESH